MSSLCQASHSLLGLRDDDLSSLKIDDELPSQDEIFVQRRIDIKLSCNFVAAGPGNSNCKLEVIAWGNGATDLCGSCSFCTLLADSMQRSVESGPWSAWDLRSKLNSAEMPQMVEIPAHVQFEHLEYRRDHAPETFGNVIFRRTSSFWDVYLLLLRGYVLLHPLNDEESRKVQVDLAFELFGEGDDPVVRLFKIHRRPLHAPRLSVENIEKMVDWIRNCDEHHSECFPKLKHLDYGTALEVTAYLPTRMIEVGDSSNEGHPKLVITSEMQTGTSKGAAIKYMALSYCWGQEYGMLRTTQKTLHSRTEKIVFDTMPQTFKDAVTIARALSIPYLWIDSLCIIQDDSRDWQIESSRMADIYSNAYLTVAAAVGSGCHDSFLNPGSPGPSCIIPLTLNQRRAIQGQFSLRFRRRRGTSDKMAEIIDSKWITRGWTFQEERLARRVLTFGENKFFLDCRTFERSQDTDRRGLRPDWASSVSEDPGAQRGTGTEISSHWGSWRVICTHFSYRELRFPEDKLPAISGMAHRIASRVESEYLAGLWRNNLMHDLFWQADAIASKPKKYRAPSWSWASLDGKVTWPSWRVFDSCTKCTLYCTVLHAQTTRVGLDSYGAVEDGFLKIRGVLDQMTVVWVRGSRSQHPWRLCHEGQEIGHVDLDIESDHLQAHGDKNPYHAIIVSKCESREEHKPRVRGLLMEKKGCIRDGYDEFARAGTFTLFAGIGPNQNGSLGLWDEAEQVIMIV
ncbi:HET-domain-containing protein [Stipitochalara longipes BDJ]|nr:HET-domain-containing protein [Stipitochalara longipes BDJ]